MAPLECALSSYHLHPCPAPCGHIASRRRRGRWAHPTRAACACALFVLVVIGWCWSYSRRMRQVPSVQIWWVCLSAVRAACLHAVQASTKCAHVGCRSTERWTRQEPRRMEVRALLCNMCTCAAKSVLLTPAARLCEQGASGSSLRVPHPGQSRQRCGRSSAVRGHHCLLAFEAMDASWDEGSCQQWRIVAVACL